MSCIPQAHTPEVASIWRACIYYGSPAGVADKAETDRQVQVHWRDGDYEPASNAPSWLDMPGDRRFSGLLKDPGAVKMLNHPGTKLAWVLV